MDINIWMLGFDFRSFFHRYHSLGCDLNVAGRFFNAGWLGFSDSQYSRSRTPRVTLILTGTDKLVMIPIPVLGKCEESTRMQKSESPSTHRLLPCTSRTTLGGPMNRDGYRGTPPHLSLLPQELRIPVIPVVGGIVGKPFSLAVLHKPAIASRIPT